MADEIQYHHRGSKSDPPPAPKAEEFAPAEATDVRGLSDSVTPEFEEKIKVCEGNKEEEIKKKNEGLLEKLHRSSSSSSDEEEVDEGGEKKKGLKEKIKEKISGENKEEEKAVSKYEDTSVPIEKCDEIPTQEREERKGFMDKTKEKLTDRKKAEEVAAPRPIPAAPEYAVTLEAEGKEKKGFLDKIKGKIPGYNSKSDEEKEKEN